MRTCHLHMCGRGFPAIFAIASSTLHIMSILNYAQYAVMPMCSRWINFKLYFRYRICLLYEKSLTMLEHLVPSGSYLGQKKIEVMVCFQPFRVLVI